MLDSIRSIRRPGQEGNRHSRLSCGWSSHLSTVHTWVSDGPNECRRVSSHATPLASTPPQPLGQMILTAVRGVLYSERGRREGGQLFCVTAQQPIAVGTSEHATTRRSRKRKNACSDDRGTCGDVRLGCRSPRALNRNYSVCANSFVVITNLHTSGIALAVGCTMSSCAHRACLCAHPFELLLLPAALALLSLALGDDMHQASTLGFAEMPRSHSNPQPFGQSISAAGHTASWLSRSFQLMVLSHF